MIRRGKRQPHLTGRKQKEQQREPHQTRSGTTNGLRYSRVSSGLACLAPSPVNRSFFGSSVSYGPMPYFVFPIFTSFFLR